MSSKALPPIGDTETLVAGLERAQGVASAPSSVLILCKLYRSQKATIAAQKDLIGKLGRDLAAARKKKAR